MYKKILLNYHLGIPSKYPTQISKEGRGSKKRKEAKKKGKVSHQKGKNTKKREWGS